MTDINKNPIINTSDDDNDDFDLESNTWTIIDRFFKQDNILIKHHITSFNYFTSFN